MSASFTGSMCVYVCINKLTFGNQLTLGSFADTRVKFRFIEYFSKLQLGNWFNVEIHVVL